LPRAAQPCGIGAGGVVARPRLSGRLGARARVSVASAPPGSGKTVLLRSWISQSGVAGSVAWVGAGRGERDPQRFWLSVLAALRQTGPGAVLVRELTAAPDLDGWVITERLLADLAPLDEALWLVVDDVHELGPETLAQLELLIMRAPPGLRFVVAARHDVRLGLHRLRLEGELAEIREPDLRFTVAEAEELFAAAGVDLPDPALLVERTEGWAAGLRLAALSLAGHRTGAAGGRILRHRADGGRIPAGRGAGPAARAGAAAVAAHLDPGAGQRGAGWPADRGQRRGAGAGGPGGGGRVRGGGGHAAVVVPLPSPVRRPAAAAAAPHRAGPGRRAAPGRRRLVRGARVPGGALAHPAPGGGVQPSIDASYLLFAAGATLTPDLATAVRAHVQAVKDALAPWHASYDYYNFEQTPALASAVLPPASYRRLQQIKAAHDPDRVIISAHPAWPARP